MSDWKPIKSSNLVAGRYDEDKQTCDVKFKSGGVYRSEGVTPESWANFEATFQSEESSGRYYAKHIKPLKFTKL